MSVVYQLAVSPGQADTYLEHGFDFFGGFAVDAADAAPLTDVADLIALLNCSMPGAPFAEDKPIDILHVPTGPFVHARQAVGPLHPHSFLGGIVEPAPFDGRGLVSAGGVITPLMWVEPARLTAGSQLWRFYPGNPEPELRGVYHGVAWGWETVKTGLFKACVPSQFIGPVVLRTWGLAPVDVELDEAGSAPAAVTIVAPAEPPEEGFEKLPTGLWAKRIAYHEGLEVFEYQAQGRLNSIPVRVMRHLANEPGSNAGPRAQVCLMLVDTPLAGAAGFRRYAQGIHTAIVPFDAITDQVAREARPASWDTSERTAITIRSARTRDNSDTETLVSDIVSLLAAVAPTGWAELRYMVQMINQEAKFSAAAIMKSEDGEPRTITLKFVPTATLHYVRQIKENTAKPNEGAALSMLFAFEPTGKAQLTINTTTAPPWADSVTREAWEAELAAFPRDAEHRPEWLRDILGS